MSEEKGGIIAFMFGGAVMLTILFFILCFRVVGVGQVGLVTRFGTVVKQTQSGVVIKAPWPIERLQKFDVKVQKEQADAQAATADLQDVHTTLALNYHLDDKRVKELYTQVGKDYKARIIDPAIQESFKATSAEFTAAELLTKRPEVKEKVLQVLKERLNKRDIIVDDVSIVNFKFSDQFTAAIEAKQVAAQQAEQAKYNVEKAKNNADAAIAEATGQAKAQEILRQNLTPEILQKLMLEKWNGALPLYVGNGVGNVFSIPVK
jgi:regulator of protease activity HflC (stomatin/prohibitin superfamily)